MYKYAMRIAAVCMMLAGCDQGIQNNAETTQEPAKTPSTQAAPAATVTAIATPPSEEHESTGVEAELIETHAPRNDIERARNAIVFIDSGFGTGSGFFIDQNCTVVTNKHVIELTFDGIKELEVQRIQTRDVLERGVFGREDRGHLQDALESIDKALNAYEGTGQAKEVKISRKMKALTPSFFWKF